jgi:hypothetical protein
MEHQEQPIFYTIDGNVPFWDSPFVQGYKKLPNPKEYKPKLTYDAVQKLYGMGKYEPSTSQILKVLGDALCCTEDQLRRYMSPFFSRSQVSKWVNLFRKDGVMDRWKLEDHEYPNKLPISGPLTIGTGGYHYLKHYYYMDFLIEPNQWARLEIPTIQKLVCLNEIRCQLFERSAMSGWHWTEFYMRHRFFNSQNKHLRKYLSLRGEAPACNVEIKAPDGRMEWVVLRTMMRYPFISYLRDRLFKYREYYEEHQRLPFTADGTKPFLVLSLSTRSMAEAVHQELLLDTFPFPIWCLVDEYIWNMGIETAILVPDGPALKRARLSFLAKKGGER